MDSDQIFPLDPEKTYFSMDELTLDTAEGPVTLRMGAWLNYDPVRIHRMIIKADPDYYKRFMGLNLIIDYPGYSSGIKASIPFENDPIGFYKWWRKGKHEDKVHLSLGNQIRLFQKVSLMDPKTILKKDLEILR